MSSRGCPAPRRLGRDQRGVVAVEFAIIGMIFFMLLLGAVDLARYQFVRQSLGSMAQEAARTALITSSVSSVQSGGCVTPPTGAALRTAVTTPVNPTPILTPASLTLNAVCNISVSGIRVVTVTASYNFQFNVPFLSVSPTLSATAALAY